MKLKQAYLEAPFQCMDCADIKRTYFKLRYEKELPFFNEMETLMLILGSSSKTDLSQSFCWQESTECLVWRRLHSSQMIAKQV